MSDAGWSNIDRDYERTRRVVEAHIAKLTNAGYIVCDQNRVRDGSGDSVITVRVPNTFTVFTYAVYENQHITDWLLNGFKQ